MTAGPTANAPAVSRNETIGGQQVPEQPLADQAFSVPPGAYSEPEQPPEAVLNPDGSTAYLNTAADSLDRAKHFARAASLQRAAEQADDDSNYTPRHSLGVASQRPATAGARGGRVAVDAGGKHTILGAKAFNKTGPYADPKAPEDPSRDVGHALQPKGAETTTTVEVDAAEAPRRFGWQRARDVLRSTANRLRSGARLAVGAAVVGLAITGPAESLSPEKGAITEAPNPPALESYDPAAEANMETPPTVITIPEEHLTNPHPLNLKGSAQRPATPAGQ